MTDRDWIVAEYDAVVAAEGDEGAVLEKSRDAVAHAYCDAVETGRIDRAMDDLVGEGRLLFDRFVGPERRRRRESMQANAEYLLSALRHETILGPSDPAFVVPFPLGDGRDKVLGLWTLEDWGGAVNERNRNAVAVAAKAHEFGTVAKEITGQMESQGCRTTADLFRAQA
jgi:hypothetical protein